MFPLPRGVAWRWRGPEGASFRRGQRPRRRPPGQVPEAGPLACPSACPRGALGAAPARPNVTQHRASALAAAAGAAPRAGAALAPSEPCGPRARAGRAPPLRAPSPKPPGLPGCLRGAFRARNRPSRPLLAPTGRLQSEGVFGVRGLRAPWAPSAPAPSRRPGRRGWERAHPPGRRAGLPRRDCAWRRPGVRPDRGLGASLRRGGSRGQRREGGEPAAALASPGAEGSGRGAPSGAPAGRGSRWVQLCGAPLPAGSGRGPRRQAAPSALSLCGPGGEALPWRARAWPQMVLGDRGPLDGNLKTWVEDRVLVPPFPSCPTLRTLRNPPLRFLD